MNKKVTIIVAVALVLGFSGFLIGKHVIRNSSVQKTVASPEPLKVLTYGYTESHGLYDEAELRLYHGGDFDLLESYMDSTYTWGKWDIQDGILCLENSVDYATNDSYRCVENCFKIDGDKIVFIEEYSGGFEGLELEDGAEFKDKEPQSEDLSEVLLEAQKGFGGARHVNRTPVEYGEADKLYLGVWESSDAELYETMVISMADPQVGGYHFEIEKDHSVISSGDAYSSEGKLILTQAYYNGDLMDGVMQITDEGLEFGFGYTGKDKNGEYVADGIMQFVRSKN